MRKAQEIHNLIFDLGGVVVRIKRIDFTIFDRQFGLRHGTVRATINACTHEAVIRKRFDERGFFEKHFGGLLPWAAYRQILLNWFATERVNRWLVKWIERRRRHYRIYLLTNQTGALSLRLKERYRIAHHFDGVFNSAEIGISKPDPRIFRLLLRRIKAPAGTCLFVDDKQKNIAMARAIGFKVIRFKDNRQFSNAIRKLKI